MNEPSQALDRLRSALHRGRTSADDPALNTLLHQALAQAAAAEPETIEVLGTTTRPRRLRLAVLAADHGVDAMYQLEWVELAASDAGELFLVFRRRDGQNYATACGQATALPTTLANSLPEPLAAALLDG